MPLTDSESFSTVKRDVENGLGDSFGPRPVDGHEAVIVHPDFEAEDEVIGNRNITAVPWIYYCTHNGDFQGLVRTGRPLEIHGITLVDTRTVGDTQLYRLVDWMGVATQLGLEVSTRVPVDEVTYRNERRRIAEKDLEEFENRGG
jgi:hypothetical protein